MSWREVILGGMSHLAKGSSASQIAHLSACVQPRSFLTPGLTDVGCYPRPLLKLSSGISRPGCPAAKGDDAAAAVMDGAVSAPSIQLPGDGCSVSVQLH